MTDTKQQQAATSEMVEVAQEKLALAHLVHATGLLSLDDGRRLVSRYEAECAQNAARASLAPVLSSAAVSDAANESRRPEPNLGPERGIMTDIFREWHPDVIAEIIKKALSGRQQKEAAQLLGITPQYLCDILHARRNLSPEVAARLDRIGLDGRHLYTMQEKRRVEVASLRVSLETVPDVSREASGSAYRERAVKAARTRKRMKLAREDANAEAEKAA